MSVTEIDTNAGLITFQTGQEFFGSGLKVRQKVRQKLRHCDSKE